MTRSALLTIDTASVAVLKVRHIAAGQSMFEIARAVLKATGQWDVDDFPADAMIEFNAILEDALSGLQGHDDE